MFADIDRCLVYLDREFCQILTDIIVFTASILLRIALSDLCIWWRVLLGLREASAGHLVPRLSIFRRWRGSL
jgi:hypothetical protein